MNKIFGTVSRGVESVEFMGKQCGIIPQKSGEWPVGKFLLARFWHGFGTLKKLPPGG